MSHDEVDIDDCCGVEFVLLNDDDEEDHTLHIDVDVFGLVMEEAHHHCYAFAHGCR